MAEGGGHDRPPRRAGGPIWASPKGAHSDICDTAVHAKPLFNGRPPTAQGQSALMCSSAYMLEFRCACPFDHI